MNPAFLARTTLVVRCAVAFGGAALLPAALRAAAPAIQTQPGVVTVCAGQDATFAVTASGAELRYQWRRAGADLPGATGASLTVPAAQADDAGLYEVVVSSGSESVTSGPAWLLCRAGGAAEPAQPVFQHRGRRLAFAVLGATTQTAASQQHTVFLQPDGTVWTVGRNDFGQLGDGTTDDRAEPVQIAADATAVAVCNEATIILKKDGTLWGAGIRGFNGLPFPVLGTEEPIFDVVPVKTATSIVAITGNRLPAVYARATERVWTSEGRTRGALDAAESAHTGAAGRAPDEN